MNENDKTTLHLTETVLDNTLIDRTDDQTRLEPYLIVLSGKDQGHAFHLHPGRNCFGRGTDADIVLNDPKVSRNHGCIVVDGEHVELVDFRSTNGCFLDGDEVSRAPVGPNNRIRAGGTIMKVEFKLPTEIEAERDLYEAATTDPLTGVLNRRAFMEGAEREYQQARRNDRGLSILMCDIDYFKRINDGHGHPAGDQVLKDLVIVLQGQLRSDDLVGRFGGEEFILLLRKTDANAAGDWAERARRLVQDHPFRFSGAAIPVTLSIGICSRPDLEATTLEAMICDADAALYEAKQRGRNCIVSAD